MESTPLYVTLDRVQKAQALRRAAGTEEARAQSVAAGVQSAVDAARHGIAR